jgi:O-antigen ligase
MARGWEVATYDLKHLLLGVGYGNGYTTLQDIFPGNRYGNFHSLFVTLLAESGIIAAVLCVILIAYPLAIGGIYRPIIAGLLIFNLFQQMQTEPILWLLLLFAWTGVGPTIPRARVRERAGPVPELVMPHSLV